MANIKGLLDKYKQVPEERFFRDVFEGQEYAPTREEKADVVVDVGALAGEFGAYIYDQAGVIYALEPYSQHFKELEENVKEFGLDKIKPFRIALAGENGVRGLDVGVRGGHTLAEDDNSGEQVPAKTLATFMKDEGIEYVDILKIDIEDGEKEVFGAADFPIEKVGLVIGEHLGGLDQLFQSNGFISSTCKNNVMYKRKTDA